MKARAYCIETAAIGLPHTGKEPILHAMLSLRFLTPALILCAMLAVPAADASEVAVKTEADGTQTMTHEVLVPAPIADVWAAISTAEGWMRWAVPVARLSASDPDILETAYDKAAAPGGPATIQQRFLVRVPGRLLAFRTIKAPEGFPHWESYRQVSSVFELEAAGGQTRVRMTSTGYPGTPAGRELVAFFRTGNADTLDKLRRLFEPAPRD